MIRNRNKKDKECIKCTDLCIKICIFPSVAVNWFRDTALGVHRSTVTHRYRSTFQFNARFRVSSGRS